MKYTQQTQEKIEAILEQAGYLIRYERGTFMSGYCILEQKKVVVLNKFLQVEGRINALVEIIQQLNFDSVMFTPDVKKMYEEVMARPTNKPTE